MRYRLVYVYVVLDVAHLSASGRPLNLPFGSIVCAGIVGVYTYRIKEQNSHRVIGGVHDFALLQGNNRLQNRKQVAFGSLLVLFDRVH